MMMAIIPAILYHLSILLMVEADSRRMHAKPIEIEGESLARLTLRHGYHFISLIAIAALLIRGMTAFRAVFWSTVLAIALSFIRPETALYRDASSGP